ncbi:hypothetical protein [Caballeronia sp. dw_19]|nr:hypothetical protein [Caballeronia sp. dw_19]
MNQTKKIALPGVPAFALSSGRGASVAAVAAAAAAGGFFWRPSSL